MEIDVSRVHADFFGWNGKDTIETFARFESCARDAVESCGAQVARLTLDGCARTSPVEAQGAPQKNTLSNAPFHVSTHAAPPRCCVRSHRPGRDPLADARSPASDASLLPDGSCRRGLNDLCEIGGIDRLVLPKE